MVILMPIFNLDIHAHSKSAISTRVGTSLSLEAVNNTMPKKGINVIGTGDCHFAPWLKEISNKLVENQNQFGIFLYQKNPAVGFILQTEIIFTAPIGNNRKQVHIIILFPDIESIKSFRNFLNSWKIKFDSIPRPFIKCDSKEEVASKIHSILEIDDLVEFIPAHIMTPTGVFGSNVRVNRLEDFFGEASNEIHAVETGLSADPEVLSLIPELDNRTLISNSDAHCADFHRLGREFFSIEAKEINYEKIIESIRSNKVVRTAEFPPEEGKYYLTGHRRGKWKPKNVNQQKNRKKWHNDDEFCFYSPSKIPKNDICPICNRKLTIGVLQRAFEICKAQGSSDQRLKTILQNKKPFRRIIPLTEVIAVSIGIKNPMAKRVLSEYSKIIDLFGTEIDFWFHPNPEKILASTTSSQLTESLVSVHSGTFSFWPPGFDGSYGKLHLGENRQYSNISVEIKG